VPQQGKRRGKSSHHSGVELALIIPLRNIGPFLSSLSFTSQYGKAWEKYCQRVPYRIFPYIY